MTHEFNPFTGRPVLKDHTQRPAVPVIPAELTIMPGRSILSRLFRRFLP